MSLELSKKITIHPKPPQLSILGQKSSSCLLIFTQMIKGSCEHIFTIPIWCHGFHLRVKTGVINKPSIGFFQGHNNFLKLIRQISENTIIIGRCTASLAGLWSCGPGGGWFYHILPLDPLIHHTLLAIVGYILSVVIILLLCVKINVWLSKVACAISLPTTMANSSYIFILLFKNSACLWCACKGKRNVENSIFTLIIKIDSYKCHIHSYNQYLLT